MTFQRFSKNCPDILMAHLFQQPLLYQINEEPLLAASGKSIKPPAL